MLISSNFCQTHLPRSVVPPISPPLSHPEPCSVGGWLVKEAKVDGMRSTSRITSWCEYHITKVTEIDRGHCYRTVWSMLQVAASKWVSKQVPIGISESVSRCNQVKAPTGKLSFCGSKISLHSDLTILKGDNCGDTVAHAGTWHRKNGVTRTWTLNTKALAIPDLFVVTRMIIQYHTCI